MTHFPLTLRWTYSHTLNHTGTRYDTWAIWCAYRPRILGAVVATGEVGGHDWDWEPVRRVA